MLNRRVANKGKAALLVAVRKAAAKAGRVAEKAEAVQIGHFLRFGGKRRSVSVCRKRIGREMRPSLGRV